MAIVISKPLKSLHTEKNNNISPIGKQAVNGPQSNFSLLIEAFIPYGNKINTCSSEAETMVTLKNSS